MIAAGIFSLSMYSSQVIAQEPSLEEMAGAMLMVGFRGATPEETKDIQTLLAKGHIGSVILFDYDVALGSPQRNVVNKQQLQKLLESLHKAAGKRRLIVAVDQEGGRVQRLKAQHGFTVLPSQEALGQEMQRDAEKGAEKISRVATQLGEELADVGINMDIAPGVDVNIFPQSPVIGALGRSYGSDPELVTHCARVFIQALEKAGVIPVIKHFPGHGSARVDTHLGFADVSESWKSKKELAPYRALFAEKFSGAVLSSHVFLKQLDAQLPASLSPAVVTGLLRNELGWQGVIMSDDLQMKAIAADYSMEESIRLSLLAGVDILIFGNNLTYDPLLPQKAHQTILELVRSGQIPESRIRQSWERIERMKESYFSAKR